MPTVNYTNPNTDRTVRIFDEFYNFEATVDAALYDLVYSFMSTVFADRTAASNFTLSIFQVSETSGIEVEEILKNLQGQDSLQLTVTLAYYLNNLRSGSTLLGVSAVQTPDVNVARNVFI